MNNLVNRRDYHRVPVTDAQKEPNYLDLWTGMADSSNQQKHESTLTGLS